MMDDGSASLKGDGKGEGDGVNFSHDGAESSRFASGITRARDAAACRA